MERTYDPALRKTAVGTRLYYYWKAVRKNPHTPEWDFFPDFYAWAMSSGYTLGAKLQLIDAELPYSPDNCVWKVKYGPNEEEAQKTRAAEWNAVVNRLRKQFGMEPLEGTDYDDI